MRHGIHTGLLLLLLPVAVAGAEGGETETHDEERIEVEAVPELQLHDDRGAGQLAADLVLALAEDAVRPDHRARPNAGVEHGQEQRALLVSVGPAEMERDHVGPATAGAQAPNRSAKNSRVRRLKASISLMNIVMTPPLVDNTIRKIFL